ncbi:MAG: aldo/keto reductase [Pseudonocardia sp.]
MAAGFLSGKYTRETLSDPDNRYAGFDILPFDKDHGFTVVERLRAVADRHDVSVAQTALAWLLAKPSVTSVFVGASKRSQLDDNLGAPDIQLAAEDVAELDAATPLPLVYPNWYIDNLTDQPVAAALDGGDLPVSIPAREGSRRRIAWKGTRDAECCRADLAGVHELLRKWSRHSSANRG